MLLKEWGERVGLIEIASNNSVWRGMDYYENKKQKMELIMELCQDKKEKIIQYILIKSILESQHVTVHLLTAGG